MPSASVSMFAACVLGLFAISYGAPLNQIVQASENLEASAQSSSYDQQSLNVVDNPYGPDYVSYDSSSGSSSSQSLEYEKNYLSATDGLYPTGGSLIQQQQQQIEQEYSASQQLASDYTNIGGNYISQQQQQQQSEYSYNKQQSSLNQVVSI